MNIQKKLLIIVFLLLICAVKSQTAQAFRFTTGYHRDIAGRIVKIQKTWVYVKDEKGIDTYRFFIHTNRLKEFEIGDRVRVYFYRNNARLISIQKMTPIRCGDGKNLGVISGCELEEKR